jgi:hypothetical protein
MKLPRQIGALKPFRAIGGVNIELNNSVSDILSVSNATDEEHTTKKIN